MFLIPLFFIITALASVAAFFVSKGNKILTAIAGVSAATLVVLANSFTIVSPGHVGIVVTLGTVNMEPLSEGIHLINPLSTVKELEVRLVTLVLNDIPAGTKDQQQVHTNITINFRLNAGKAAYI